MEAWLRSTFDIVPGGWVEGEAVSDAFVFSPVTASVDAFLAKFGSVSAPPTAAALKAVDSEDNWGWHQHFDAWAEDGIIQP